MMESKYYKLVDEKLEHFTCDNGLKVYLLKKDGYQKSYGIFATKFGSCNNEFIVDNKVHKVIDGAAHFLEHKMFEKQDYDIMDVFNKQHASGNAFTSFDKTAYLFSASDYAEQNVETLLNFVQNLELSKQSVEKEKPIIAAEINMYDDDVEWQSFFGSLQSLYVNNSVKIDIAGTIDTIQQITKEDLAEYYDYFYHPSNMILFVCGNIEPQKLEKVIRENQAQKSFKKLSFTTKAVEEPKEVNVPFAIKYMDINNTRLTLSFKVNEMLIDYQKQDLGMSILMDMLFSKKSAFYQNLFNNQIITDQYSYQYNQDNNHDYAFAQLSFTTNQEDILIDKLAEYFASDIQENLDIEEFNLLKAKYLGDFIRIFNNPEAIANSFIAYYANKMDLFTVIDIIKEITFEDISKLCAVFDPHYQCINIIKKKA